MADALDALAGRKGNKSQLVNDGLREWLKTRALKSVDTMLQHRLDRISRKQDRVSQQVHQGLELAVYTLEALMLFVQHELTVTASLQEMDAAAKAKGAKRYQEFIDRLGVNIAKGTAFSASNDDAVNGAREGSSEETGA
ncbi:CopG family transcriptional regulator [Novosphingobium sp. JCM 18896]|uniref:CopG family transcriptional regulator n=1 Tax=Novosphingobium sp. JCM 18896 TaxID=2989731 RepID=UPI002222CACC|nr:CopG family transcriptional regulator [Novosphingobium sp. JCM 18896]MCW1430908.1 CopG family transcriptional regulator [Novosphingobium sp. JCM 18896]